MLAYDLSDLGFHYDRCHLESLPGEMQTLMRQSEGKVSIIPLLGIWIPTGKPCIAIRIHKGTRKGENLKIFRKSFITAFF